MPKVWNKRDPNTPSDAVYVGRPTRWGNPFVMTHEMDRAEVLRKYRAYLKTRPLLVRAMKAELRGSDLICWCAPLPCHADIILEVANA